MNKCQWCAKGLQPHVLDEDGTLSIITGKLGTLCHSLDNSWWPCGLQLIGNSPGRVHPTRQAFIDRIEELQKQLTRAQTALEKIKKEKNATSKE